MSVSGSKDLKRFTEGLNKRGQNVLNYVKNSLEKFSS
jgi:hypothetical protein